VAQPTENGNHHIEDYMSLSSCYMTLNKESIKVSFRTTLLFTGGIVFGLSSMSTFTGTAEIVLVKQYLMLDKKD
jgi:hypothetical protein